MIISPILRKTKCRCKFMQVPWSCNETQLHGIHILAPQVTQREQVKFSGLLITVLTSYITFKGSLSCRETNTSTWLFSTSWRRPCTTFRKPRSVLLWSHKTTLVPLQTASRTSWCDISPVRYKSALTPRRTLEPEPAHTATEVSSVCPVFQQKHLSAVIQ